MSDVNGFPRSQDGNPFITLAHMVSHRKNAGCTSGPTRGRESARGGLSARLSDRRLPDISCTWHSSKCVALGDIFSHPARPRPEFRAQAIRIDAAGHEAQELPIAPSLIACALSTAQCPLHFRACTSTAPRASRASQESSGCRQAYRSRTWRGRVITIQRLPTVTCLPVQKTPAAGEPVPETRLS